MLPTIQEQTYKATGFWHYALRVRGGVQWRSLDFLLSLFFGVIADGVLFGTPHGSILKISAQTMIVAFLAITGGFLGTSLSILVGMIPRPIAKADSIQYLAVVFDFAWTVCAVYLAAASWILAALTSTLHGPLFGLFYVVLKGWLPFATCCAVLATFAAVHRLFRLAAFALIAEESVT